MQNNQIPERGNEFSRVNPIQTGHSRKDRSRGGRSQAERSRGDIIISRVLIIVGVLLLAIALTIGGTLIFQYIDAQNRYRELATVAGLNVPTEVNVVTRELRLEDIIINWDALRARNPEVVGWIIIPGTRVNYPIAKGSDNDYYLYHLFDETSSGTGTIFADYQGSTTLDAQNNMIYGHNMLDGSMFSDLNMFISPYYLSEHQTVFLATPARNFELRAIATLRPSGNEELRVFNFADEEEFDEYLAYLFSFTVARVDDFDQVFPEIKSVYSFITCQTNNNENRIILAAIPVRSVVQPA